jgi:hypothetical protein
MFPYSQTKLTSQSSSHLALIAKTINHKKKGSIALIIKLSQGGSSLQTLSQIWSKKALPMPFRA